MCLDSVSPLYLPVQPCNRRDAYTTPLVSRGIMSMLSQIELTAVFCPCEPFILSFCEGQRNESNTSISVVLLYWCLLKSATRLGFVLASPRCPPTYIRTWAGTNVQRIFVSNFSRKPALTLGSLGLPHANSSSLWHGMACNCFLLNKYSYILRTILVRNAKNCSPHRFW